MQHYGQKRDEETKSDLSDSDALERIGSLLSQVKNEFADAEACLQEWYKNNSRDE